MGRSRVMIRVGVITAALAIGGVLGYLGWTAWSPGDSPGDAADSDGSFATRVAGSLGARSLCVSCHRLPPPDALTRREWSFALSSMGLFLGQELRKGGSKLDYRELHKARQHRRQLAQIERYLSSLDLVPDEPAVPDEMWQAVRSYFLSQAPRRRPRAEPVVYGDADWFEVAEHGYQKQRAFTSMVHIDEATRSLFVGDIGVGAAGRETGGPVPTLTRLSAAGEVLATLHPAGSPLDMTATADRFLVTTMGGFFPDPDDPRPAQLLSYRRDALDAAPTVVIDGMMRTANSVLIDLDGDGTDEIVSSGFGFGLLRLGGVVLHRLGDDGTYREKVLWQWPGVLRVEVFDADEDGHLDVLALAAGAREGVYMLRGPLLALNVESVPVFEQHPAFGFTHMLARDIDGDGRRDLVVVNGDNTDGDLRNTRRPYHGVRVLANRGGGVFEPASFFALPGASMAAVADFDLDGDPDIAVAAAYPDLSAEPLRSFALLEQTEPLVFRPRTHPAAQAGRWITIDAADLDGDGDPDIALGGFHYPLGANQFSEAVGARLERMGETAPPVLLLANTRAD